MLSLADTDGDAPNRTDVCECGNGKTANANACAECSKLENQRKSPTYEERVLAGLRWFDWVDSSDLHEALGVGSNSNPSHRRGIDQALSDLVRTGRVSREKRQHHNFYKLVAAVENDAGTLCKRCGSPTEPGRVMCKRHLAKVAAARRRQYEDRKRRGVCVHCAKPDLMTATSVTCSRCQNRRAA